MTGPELYEFIKNDPGLMEQIRLRMMRGREARIRTVMTLIVDDVLRELESQEV